MKDCSASAANALVELTLTLIKKVKCSAIIRGDASTPLNKHEVSRGEIAGGDAGEGQHMGAGVGGV